MDLGLAGRAYIVTGASRGLGRATAQVLVDEGAKVVVSSRSAESVEQAAAALGPDSALGIAADNADPATADRLVQAALDRFGRLDGAVVSVGGPAPGGVAEVSDEQWQDAFSTVFLGAVRLARTVSEKLEPGGSIVFVLSGSVKQPITGLAISNGLRPGLAMVAKTLSDELGPKGIRVNGVLPGRVETERIMELDSIGGDREAAKAANIEHIPLRRYGQPEEFGRAAAFLVSPAAAYITGVMLPVDGGITRGL